MFKVIKNFTDLQDNNHKYVAGDVYPRNGLKVSAGRLNELASSNNRRGTPMIEEVVNSAPVEPEEVKEPVKKSAPKKGKKK